MGMGCWAIGGTLSRDGKPDGWSGADDAQSILAIHRAIDLGINFFDTADMYGGGHSERLLAQALSGGKRDKIVLATKFGLTFDEQKREAYASDASPDYIRRACDASLRRLNTDRIDLYQFHVNQYDPALAPQVIGVLEELVSAGKIRWYGWSTDNPLAARVFAEQGAHCTAIQQHLNIFAGNAEVLAICEQHNLASINRGPLGMGLLTGKFSADSQIPADDIRSRWNLHEGDMAKRLEKLAALRDVLTSDGRSLAQGALGYLWALSKNTIPIPGFKNTTQVEENVGALKFGPLSPQQMATVRAVVTSL